MLGLWQRVVEDVRVLSGVVDDLHSAADAGEFAVPATTKRFISGLPFVLEHEGAAAAVELARELLNGQRISEGVLGLP